MRVQFQDLQTAEVVFDREFIPSQEVFWKATEKYILLSGGFGCGKTMVMLLRSIYECMSQENNYFLLGRKTYAEIHDVLLKDFFEICHPSWIVKYTKTPQPSVTLHTFQGGTSEIIFRNLDKLSEGEIKGLNLGGFGIDQAEDVPFEIFLALKGRLRRPKVTHRAFMTANPALTWLYREFKLEAKPEYKLIEASTLENEKNLPKDYVADLKRYPPSLFNQYVLGKWDESLLSNNIVFAREYIERLQGYIEEPTREHEGLKIYREYEAGHRYQMGIDCAEGSDAAEADRFREIKKDNGIITIVDLDLQEEVAVFSAKIPPGALAEKAVYFASLYGNPTIVIEMNSVGTAALNRLQDLGYDNLYRRVEFDKVLNKRLKKVGFRMTPVSKRLIISHFEDRLRLAAPKIRSRQTLEEFKTFIYTDVAGRKGAGAKEGYHDDRVVSLLLAFFEEGDVKPGFTAHSDRRTIPLTDELVPTLEIRDGKFLPPKFWREEQGKASWKTL